MEKLRNKRVAILSENGFEETELTSPKEALEAAGVLVEVISPQSGTIKGWKDGQWTIDVNVDTVLSEAHHLDYDGLVLPGGVINPDKLRINEEAITFIQAFFEKGKPVAAICHGPQSLINADVVAGRRMTSYKSVRKDLENAGALWEDSEVVVDHGLVTSRDPNDLPAFNKKLLEELAEGVHAEQHA